LRPYDDEPFRGELLGADRLAAAARSLARAQRWASGPTSAQTPVLGLLERASDEIAAVYRTLAADVREDIPVAPAAEWLLDNYYLVEEQVRFVADDLPARYAVRLPCLTEGAFAGYPRVMELMAFLLAHTDSRVDEESLIGVVSAYQQATDLSIGEVWACRSWHGPSSSRT